MMAGSQPFLPGQRTRQSWSLKGGPYQDIGNAAYSILLLLHACHTLPLQEQQPHQQLVRPLQHHCNAAHSILLLLLLLLLLLHATCYQCRSNNHITEWSGPYNIPAGKVLWAHMKDVTFRPKGAAFCPKPDHDLQPAT
jgi:hypothetical protein